MQFDTIEAGRLGVLGALAELFDDPGQFGAQPRSSALAKGLE
jgi:hypothetical protein